MHPLTRIFRQPPAKQIKPKQSTPLKHQTQATHNKHGHLSAAHKPKPPAPYTTRHLNKLAQSLQRANRKPDLAPIDRLSCMITCRNQLVGQMEQSKTNKANCPRWVRSCVALRAVACPKATSNIRSVDL